MKKLRSPINVERVNRIGLQSRESELQSPKEAIHILTPLTWAPVVKHGDLVLLVLKDSFQVCIKDVPYRQ